jgi:hypothetical protein
MHTLDEARRLNREGKPWHVRLENRTSRHAFYEARSAGDGVAFFGFGRIGTHGRWDDAEADKVLRKMRDKLAGDYRVAALGGAAPAPAPAPTPTPARPLRSLRERVGSTTMKPCTRDDLMDKAVTCGLEPASVDAEQARGWHPRADAVTVLRGSAGHLRGRLLVVVRHGESLTWGVIPEE